jgi:hypothetical protein
VALSLIEGIFAGIGFWPFKKYRQLSYILAGELGTASNVVTFQLVAPFNDMFLFGLTTIMAFISGAVFAGVFSLGLVDSLEDAGILRKEKAKKEGLRITATKAAALLVSLSIIILVGSVVFMPPKSATGPSTDDPGTINGSSDNKDLKFMITGSVSDPKEYNFYDLKDKFITMQSQKIMNPNKQVDYTGIQLKYVLNEAGIKPGALKVAYRV